MRLPIVLLAILTTPVLAQPIEPQSCIHNATYKLLDFWLGDWNVYVGDNHVGTNTIEKTMKGCAVLEHWQSVDGGRSMSLFYVDGQGTWKQGWVTEYGTMPGGVKEKTREALPDADQVRFQGRIFAEDDRSYLDRTTLTNLGNGEVHQLIEASIDEGATWRPVFDAVYRKRSTE